jgi:hypothetical protein
LFSESSPAPFSPITSIPSHEISGYCSDMDAQQSPDKGPSRIKSESAALTKEFLAEDIASHGLVAPKVVESVSIRDRNFSLSILVRADSSKRVEWVLVKAFMQDGTPVAHYSTSGSIPETISREVLRLGKEYDRRKDPQALLKDVVALFRQRFPVGWDVYAPTPVPTDKGKIPKFLPFAPTIDAFALRPGVVDEQLVAVVSTEQGFDRLVVRMNPNLGFMRCSIESDTFPGDPREWKITARLDSKLDVGFLRNRLERKANDLLVRLHLDGAQEVIDILDQGRFDARAIPGLSVLAHQRDSKLAHGHIDIADQSKDLEHSSARVSLSIGTRCAVIQIVPYPEDLSQSTSIVFKCSDHYPELTAFQLHYIEKAYKLITSDSAAERYRGARMCSSQDGIRPYPFEESPPEERERASIDSIYRTEFEYWGEAPDLNRLLGEEAADTLNRLREIRFVDPPPDSTEEIVNLLDGGRRIMADRLESDLSRANPHWFSRLVCTLMADGSIRVKLSNSIGGVLRAVIDPDKLAQASDSASTIEELFQSFARSTGNQWTDVLGHVERLAGQSSSDVGLRLVDPLYENIPPFEDQMGLRMLSECVKLSAYVTATIPPSEPMKSQIRYAGLGSAQVSFFRSEESPMLTFLLQNNELREVVIGRPNVGTEQHGHGAVDICRFRAEGLRLYSEGYADILDEAHEYAKQVNANSWGVWWNSAFPQVLKPIVTVLSTRMKLVASSNRRTSE